MGTHREVNVIQGKDVLGRTGQVGSWLSRSGSWCLPSSGVSVASLSKPRNKEWWCTLRVLSACRIGRRGRGARPEAQKHLRIYQHRHKPCKLQALKWHVFRLFSLNWVLTSMRKEA